MRVSGIDVDYFLGFRRLRLGVDPQLQLVAGPNNAGKSSLIRLLESFFGNPAGQDLLALLPQNAYYRDMGARTLSTIQVWFTDLDDDERHAFAPILRRDGRIWLKLRCSRSGEVTFRASQSVTADEAKRLYGEVLTRFHFVKIPSVRIAGESAQGEHESLARLLDTLEAILVRTGTSRSTSLQQTFAGRMEPLNDLVKEVLDQSAEAIASDLPFQESTVRFRPP